MQLAQVAGVVLALFGLGRVLARRWLDGVAVAVAAAMSAGTGILIWLVPALIDPTPKIGGPRLTFNASLHNVPPALPRDVGVRFVAALWLAAEGLSGRPRLAGRGRGGPRRVGSVRARAAVHRVGGVRPALPAPGSPPRLRRAGLFAYRRSRCGRCGSCPWPSRTDGSAGS